MSNEQHNDPLEEFFKKKVQEYDIEYQEEDWLKLERRLDAAEADQNKQSYWKRYSAAAAVILLLSVLAYYTYEQQQKIDQLNERLTRSEQVTDPQSKPTEILPEGLFNFSFPAESSDNHPLSRSEPNQSSNNNIVDGSQNNSGNTQREEKLNKDSYQSTVVLASLSDPEQFITEETTFAGTKVSDFAGKDLTPRNTKGQFISISNATKSSNGFNTKNQLPRREISQFTIGLIGGPDMSTVGGISNFYNPGYKIGLSAEYALTKNLAISVGAIHSRVQYTASGNDYNPPEGYWSYGAVPQETVGKCLLIDIPISLKYNVLHFDDSRIFASGGVSSYIMLNEDYRFSYDGYSSGQPQRWQERTGTRHWMSNAVFSLGYEMDLKSNISLRIEPFIKVPIQEVGWANVKLYSMGSFISVNYNIF